MARTPLALTDPQMTEVETLAAVLSSEQIADYLGIGRRTFYTMMERDTEMAARYKRGRAKAIGAIAQSLIAKARSGNITAMIFFLKTQAGWRETIALEQVPDIERTTLDMSRLSDGALQELAAAFAWQVQQQQRVPGDPLIEMQAQAAIVQLPADACDL